MDDLLHAGEKHMFLVGSYVFAFFLTLVVIQPLAISTSENRWVHLGWEQFGNDPIDYWIIDQGTGTDPSVNVPSEATYSCL